MLKHFLSFMSLGLCICLLSFSGSSDGADISNAEMKWRELEYAAKYADLKTVRELLFGDVRFINRSANYYSDRLVSVAVGTHIEEISDDRVKIVRLLLEHGFDPAFYNDFALDIAAANQHDTSSKNEMINLLTVYGANPNAGGVLASAVTTGHYRTISLLLNLGAIPDNNLLSRIVLISEMQVVLLFLDHGLDPNHPHLFERAIKKGETQLVNALINRQINLNTLYPSRTEFYTPVTLAILSNKLNVLKLLHRAGADFAKPDGQQRIPCRMKEKWIDGGLAQWLMQEPCSDGVKSNGEEL
ncbi:MAG: hypothetical protein MI864_07300 [Pseudomonadales bacterium]|uniref:Uncharacterized protein n=1 Tax=Oleiphilus messinensis TaxID=141451 RepID=A0A1Y0I278_9GAMM|nr:hypothetical protein [Oleiphilus messinensis]ARU54572.1 hypothetical protein OLMES_0468 [Oleiphilus messinensis]MCG8610326.1 hypothetical protein [Pseudomonadales bacterium]